MQDLSVIINQVLEDNKAIDIKSIDVSDLTDITDKVIICTATSDRHSKNMADKVIAALKEEDIKPFGSSGKDTGKWILLDYTDVVVHIMLKEEREFYDMERLWSLTQTSRESNA